MSDTSKNMNSKDLSSTTSQTLGTIQDQLATYGAQIQDYLKNMQAEVSDYKFAVEKTESGLDIDVRFKAQVRLSNMEEDDEPAMRMSSTSTSSSTSSAI